MIKKCVLPLLFLLALIVSIAVQAQTQRQLKPAAVATTAVDTGGIEAYSDTTSADTVASVQQMPSIDDWDIDNLPVHVLKDIFSIDGGIMGLLVGLICLIPLLLLAIPIFIGVAIYLLLRNRDKRMRETPRTTESAARAEASSDGTILRETAADTTLSNDSQWRNGMRALFLGVGIAVCCYCFGYNKLAGIGWLITICGAGQAWISKKRK